MKQTVVDIIYDFMYKMKSFGEFNPYHFNTEEVFKKLKQMEKEQIIRAHLMARCYDTENSVNEAEQYYNETYSSERTELVKSE
jgi:MoaA/NifB/PqqE/SkfB family radical SAM enzyme